MIAAEFITHKLNLMGLHAYQGQKLANQMKIGKRRKELKGGIRKLMCLTAMLDAIMGYTLRDEDDEDENFFTSEDMEAIQFRINMMYGTPWEVEWNLEI